MEGLTINEAAETTGWSPRMLRYIESAGLIEPPRTPKGYRIFGPGELQRLRTLRELLARFDCALSDVAFAKRHASDPELRAALEHWFEERPQRPEGVDSNQRFREARSSSSEDRRRAKATSDRPQSNRASSSRSVRRRCSSPGPKMR